MDRALLGKIGDFSGLTSVAPNKRESFMARVTVEDCLAREENRFALVVLAATRTRQIMKGSHALVRAKNKPSVLSLREIAAGKVHFNRPSTQVVEEWIEAAIKRDP
jgi:DNA-directed RNA polymerase subunit omega